MISAAAGAAASDPLEIPVDHRSLGVIREADGPVAVEFTIVNRGERPLRILDARANCGCTTPTYPRTEILPADSAKIRVEYDPAGRPGRFRKKVVINTNTEPARHTFTIEGSVIGSEETLSRHYPYELGAIRVKDRILTFGDVADRASRGGYIEAYNVSPDTIQPWIDKVSPYLSVIVQPAEVPPGEQFIYSVVLQANKHNIWGAQDGSFTIHPDRGAGEGLAVDVVYSVHESFDHLSEKQRQDAPRIAVTDTRVDLGRIPSGKSAHATVRISNRGTDPLKIRHIHCPDSSVGFKLKKAEIKKGKSAELIVSIPAETVAAAKEMVNIPFTIYSNDPMQAAMPMRLVGEITTDHIR